MPKTGFTAEQLLALPSGRDRFEIVRGELRTMSPAGWLHGAAAARIARLLGNYVDAHRLGTVFAAETGCWLEHQPDTVRAADVSFVCRERMRALAPGPGFFPGAPDLVIEVLSPSDTVTKVADKVACWLATGCRLVWVIDPERRCGEVHRPGAAPERLAEEDTLVGGEVVPGFVVRLADALQP